jgi:hypothetical protein
VSDSTGPQAIGQRFQLARTFKECEQITNENPNKIAKNLFSIVTWKTAECLVAGVGDCRSQCLAAYSSSQGRLFEFLPAACCSSRCACLHTAFECREERLRSKFDPIIFVDEALGKEVIRHYSMCHEMEWV